MQKAKQSVKSAVKKGRNKAVVFSVFIYLLYGTDGICQVRARADVIAEHKPARLTAIIPADLEAGTYYIEVRKHSPVRYGRIAPHCTEA